jgi:hypothetical protein
MLRHLKWESQKKRLKENKVFFLFFSFNFAAPNEWSNKKLKYFFIKDKSFKLIY